ncbi:ribosome biogenesis GTPase Der [Mycoplasmopsis agassizii]|uniref:GTPase Der n=1 Tax=Mycoplasmopsis agassizii TaxID=33922 RepID=A0ABX4H412_9BACT|nr:ribosome biogenesis GTPase Der [Mycoplasmopsis agassizii]PAF54624.1 ribosome biogenesis GTPase Der [Mycoplasmopsis agassizii]SMC16329.1 GTP-binding protein [Mycoplasmopsis agassizii]
MKKLAANNKVAIVGKPNVGKSTLFNRLVGKRKSIVYDEPGVTRDRLYEEFKWNGKSINIIDTGGIEISDKPFAEQIRLQAQIAITEASQIIFVVDGRYALDDSDLLIAQILRTSNKQIYVVSNKLEANQDPDYDVYRLGFEDYFTISALHGEGIGEILDLIVNNIDYSQVEENKHFKLSIIGKPNSGKSSLLNTLLNEERAIVSDIAGTTRDAIQEVITIEDEPFFLVDTAGILKKSKLVDSVDHYALMRAIDSLEDSDLALVVIDATRELSHFDARLIGYADERHKPIILVINKWDLIERDQNAMRDYENKLKEKYPFVSWMPFVFLSALKKQRIHKLKEMIIRVKNNINRKIKQQLLNELIVDMQSMQPAPSFNGGQLQIARAIQAESKTPTFIFFVNDVKFLHFSYKRYIENQLREYFDFLGTPINLIFKRRT